MLTNAALIIILSRTSGKILQSHLGIFTPSFYRCGLYYVRLGLLTNQILSQTFRGRYYFLAQENRRQEGRPKQAWAKNLSMTSKKTSIQQESNPNRMHYKPPYYTAEPPKPTDRSVLQTSLYGPFAK